MPPGLTKSHIAPHSQKGVQYQTTENQDEQTEERFNGDTGPSLPTSFIHNLNVIH